MKNNIIVVNEIVKYESNFKEGLVFYYKGNIEEFKNDLINEINNNEAVEVLEYYRSCFNGLNDTNSIEEKRKALYGIILMLEGFID